MASRRLIALGAVVGLALATAIPVAANDRHNAYTATVLVSGPAGPFSPRAFLR